MPRERLSLPSTSGVVHFLGGNWPQVPTALFFHPGVGVGQQFPALQGCTAELCGLRDQFGDLQRAGVSAYGISTLDLSVLSSFAAEHDIQFPLVSDPGRVLGDALGVRRQQAGPVAVYERITLLARPDHPVRRIRADEHQVDAIVAALATAADANQNPDTATVVKEETE